MKKQRSQLELLMREIGNALQIGFQFYYKSNARHNRKRGIDGRWIIEIWDQRPGHYAKATKKDPTDWDLMYKKVDPSQLKTFNGNYLIYHDGPEQKWYNNQHSDYHESIDDIIIDKQRKWTKDEFIYYMLFKSEKFFQALPWLKCFSIEQLIFQLEIAGKDTSKILKLLNAINGK